MSEPRIGPSAEAMHVAGAFALACLPDSTPVPTAREIALRYAAEIDALIAKARREALGECETEILRIVKANNDDYRAATTDLMRSKYGDAAVCYEKALVAIRALAEKEQA